MLEPPFIIKNNRIFDKGRLLLCRVKFASKKRDLSSPIKKNKKKFVKSRLILISNH